MFCNFSFAEQIVMNCLVANYQIKSLKKSDRKRFVGKTIKLLINTEEQSITNIKPQNDLFLLHGVDTFTAIKIGPRKVKEHKMSDGSVFKLKRIEPGGKGAFNYQTDVTVGNEVWNYNVGIGLTKDKAHLMVNIASTADRFSFRFPCDYTKMN